MPWRVSAKKGLMTPGSSLSSGSSIRKMPWLRVGSWNSFAGKRLQMGLRNPTTMPGVSPPKQDLRPGSGPDDFE